MTLEKYKRYVRTWQLTPEGVDRYHELANRHPLPPRAAGEFAALEMLITLHPLDYIVKRKTRGVMPDFEALRRKGYAEEVGDRYGRMVSLLDQHDPTLLPAFRAYKKLSYGEDFSESELDEALSILKGRAQKESDLIMRAREEVRTQREELARERPDLAGTIESINKGLSAPPKHLQKFVEVIGEPETQEEKVDALDAAMHELHWDPDLVRQLPKREQSVVGGSIQSWLRQMAGDAVSGEEVELYEE